MNSVFLGKEGLTSTSANYLANLAKEQSKVITQKLDSIRFINKTVELISGSEAKWLIRGWSSVSSLDKDLKQLSNLMAFCAWVREAIKEKDALTSKVAQMTLEEYTALVNKSMPVRPVVPKTVETKDIIKEMSIKERNEYYTLEAFAATFGQYIHPEGAISCAREELLQRLEEPNEVSGSGRDLVIYGYTNSLPLNEVEHCFVSLQNQYREYERRLNAIKASIKEEVNKRNLKSERDYATFLQEYNSAISELTQEMSIYVQEQTREIANLKIVIPDKLRDTYEYLNSLGK